MHTIHLLAANVYSNIAKTAEIGPLNFNTFYIEVTVSIYIHQMLNKTHSLEAHLLTQKWLNICIPSQVNLSDNQ